MARLTYKCKNAYLVPYAVSSRGRGPRAAIFFSDYLNAQADSLMEGIVLIEGIERWANAGEKFAA
jgi:arsenical-resistance protein 2